MGSLLSTEDFKCKYGVDQVFYVDEIAEKMTNIKPSLVLTLVCNSINSPKFVSILSFKLGGKKFRQWKFV